MTRTPTWIDRRTGSFSRSLWLASCLLSMTCSALAAEATLPDYKLHAGDKIDVAVWKEKELSREITVTPDGKFSYPLVGEITAVDRTLAQVRAEIENRLKKYIPEPVVTVSVTQVNGNVAYIIGQVNKAGALVMNPAINVMQALSLSGGTTPFAKVDSIIIIRNGPGGQQVLKFRYSQVSEGNRLEQNIQLESGDVIIVP